MDITDLLIGLCVKLTQLAAGGVLESLLEVRVQTAPASESLVGDLVALVDALGALGGVVLLVEVAQGGGEPRGEAMLLVQGDGLLDGIVTHHVPVRQILGDNAGPRLVFLGDVVLVFLLGAGGGGLLAGELVDVGGGLDVDGGAAQLGLVEEQGGLSSAVSCKVSVRYAVIFASFMLLRGSGIVKRGAG